MKWVPSICLLIVVWALIYPPLLGESQIRGEEARRIIPALEMMEDQQWIVPTIAGEYYGNKPPLINWLVAGSFWLTGSDGLGAARLVSILSLLIVAVGLFWTLRGRFGNDVAVAAALVLLTTGTVIDKCRVIEIEAVYLCLFSLACFSWIRLWTSERSPWLVWTIPYGFLGWGCLAKGPLHLLFWLLFLVPILRLARRGRDFFHPAHLLGVIVMLAVCLPWVWALLGAVERPDDSVSNWSREISASSRFSGRTFGSWAIHPVEMLMDFFPWTIPLAYAYGWMRRDRIQRPPSPLVRWDAVTYGVRWSVLLSVLALLSVPGGSPRYLLPVFGLLALVMVDCYRRMSAQARLSYDRFAYVAFLVALLVALCVVIGASVVAVQEGLQPRWLGVILGAFLMVGTLVWLFRTKTKTGLFVFASVSIAVAFFGVNMAIAPHQGQSNAFRDWSDEILELTGHQEGGRVFYVDPEFRKNNPRHLRLLYYLRDEFSSQGESQSQLPSDTRYVIGPSASLEPMMKLIEPKVVKRFRILQIEDFPLTLLELEAAK